MDILKAFDTLILEKAVKKGERKVNNPRYRRVMKGGRYVYVKVDGGDGNSGSTPVLSVEEFREKRASGTVDTHYDEPPQVRSQEDLEALDFLNERSIDTVQRCLGRIEWYKRSIKFAEAIGNRETASAHRNSLQNNYNVIDTTISRDFNRKGITLFDESVTDVLKNLGFNIKGSAPDGKVTPSNEDFVNNNFEGFDFIALCQGINESIEKQKAAFDKKGIPSNKWNPTKEIAFSNGEFRISLNNPAETVTDDFGYKHSMYMSMSRSFSGAGGRKQVYHNLFKLGSGTTANNEVNSLRGGFAKGIMQHFYKQYKNARIDTISVKAAGQSYGIPYCGSNTWGKWGFTVNRATAKSIIDGAADAFRTPQRRVVDEFVIDHVDRDDIHTWKKNENGEWSKIQFTNGEFQEEGRNGSYKIVTKEHEGKFRSKIVVEKEILPSDIENMKRVFEADGEKNGIDTNFRLRHLYEGVDNQVLRGVLTSMWGGSINLNDMEQAKDFEKNLYKRYEKPPREITKTGEAE